MLFLKQKENHLKLPSAIKGWFNPQHHPDTLLERFALTGEQTFLTELVSLYNRMLFHYLLTQSDHATAEDILQTTWLKAINNIHLYKSGISQKYWLFAIARNSLFDELRRQKRWQIDEISDSQLSSPNVADHIEKQELLSQFNNALTSLPSQQRECFIFQQEGFSLKEIADLCDEPQETIKSRLRYARNTLKALLEKNQ